MSLAALARFQLQAVSASRILSFSCCWASSTLAGRFSRTSLVADAVSPVSYTHLTLPTIYSV